MRTHSACEQIKPDSAHLIMGYRLYAENPDGSRLIHPRWGSDSISHVHAWATVVDFVVRKLYDAEDLEHYVFLGNPVDVGEISKCVQENSDELSRLVGDDAVEKTLDWFEYVRDKGGKVVAC